MNDFTAVGKPTYLCFVAIKRTKMMSVFPSIHIM